MARATRSTAALEHQPQHPQRKRKRLSSPAARTPSKLHRTVQNDDDDPDIHLPNVSLIHRDAQKILDVLELSDTQGLLDRVFPSAHAVDTLVSLRTLLKHPTDHPLATVKAAIANLRPISSFPRSRPSPAASQQLAFANLAHALIEQASFNAILPSLDKESILEPVSEDETPISKPLATDIKRRYALVQHLPQGDYWTSLSSDAAPTTLKQLSTGHAELVAILPSSSSTSVDSLPSLGSVSSRPLGLTKKSAGQRRVTTGAFLDYGPYASFAPCFDHNGEVVGQRQLGQLLYQKEQKKRQAEERLRSLTQGTGSVVEIEEDVVMNGDAPKAESLKSTVDVEEEMSGLLPPEDIQAIKEAMGSLELENAVQELLERNQCALQRLEELQRYRFSKGGSKFTPAEEGSEEWETATCIMESLATLSSLRPRSSNSDVPSLIPAPSVLRKLHRSLALEASPGWYGNLPATRTTTLHDDSTVKVKSPTVAPATATAAPTSSTAAPIAQPPTSAYAGYSYNYPQQQQAYRPPTTYSSFKAGQTPGYYQTYGIPATTQQSYYGPQSYGGGSNQQPYGASTTQQPYSTYQGWYTQYQPTATAAKSTATPVATPGSYASFYNANATVNGARTPAVANTAASNKLTNVGQPAQATGTWPTANYPGQSVAPTLPSHLRTVNQTGTAAYQSYYQAYQGPAATPPAR